jgi:hypothetical protein
MPRYRLKFAENALRYYKCYKAIASVLGDCLVYSDGDAAIPLKAPCHIDAMLVLDSPACAQLALRRR